LKAWWKSKWTPYILSNIQFHIKKVISLQIYIFSVSDKFKR